MLMVSVLWVIVTCSREITVVDLYQVETFAEQIYLGYSLGNGNGPGVWPATIDTEINVGFAKTAIYVSLLAIAAVVMFIVLADTRRPNENDTIAFVSRSNRLAATVGVLMLLLLVAIPAANVFFRASFYVDTVDGQLTQNYSIDQVARVLKKSWLDYRWEMIWSLAISLASATTAIACSITLVRWTSGSTVKRLIFALIVNADLVVVCLVGQLHDLRTGSCHHDFLTSSDRASELVCVTSNTPKRRRSRIAGWFERWSELLAHSRRWKFENDYWLLALGLRTMFW